MRGQTALKAIRRLSAEDVDPAGQVMVSEI
jgi:hypothetical protein